MEKNNRERKQTAMKTVYGKKRKRITITNHDDDDADKKRSSWSDLPYDILESIKKRLFFINQVNFHVVCKSWSCIPRVAPLQQIPWLLVFDDNNEGCWNRKEKDIVDSCKLVDSNNKKTYTIDANVIKDKLKIPTFQAMKVHESKYGWLLISNQQTPSRLFFYSPFFSEGHNFIELPVLMNCYIDWATFTSNPLDKDCKILTLRMNFHDFRIYTYHRGQGSWSCQKFPRISTMQTFLSLRLSRNWIYSEGNFYFVTSDGTMGKFDMVLGQWSVIPMCAALLKRKLQYISLPLHHYIVKSSSEELFLISDSNMKTNSYAYGDYNSKQTKYHNWGITNTHHIHRLDLSSMTWEDLDSIGDQVLFIGDGYNSVLNSSVLKSNGERKGISDKIYYCDDDELKYCSVHDYTLKTKTTTRIDQKPYRKQRCSRHYGPIATKRCRKMLIDPPPR